MTNVTNTVTHNKCGKGEGKMAGPESDDKKGLQHTKKTSVPQEGGRVPLQCHLTMTEQQQSLVRLP